MRSRLWVMLLALPVALAGCRSGGGGPTPPPVRMLDSHWALVALGGEPPAGETRISLHLGADGQFSGHAGVNRYFGPYTISDDDGAAGSIAFGEVGSTRMAGPPELMQQEDRYLAALRSVDAYRAGGGLLELSSSGRPLLRYRQTAGDDGGGER